MTAIVNTILWYLSVSILGWVTFPVLFRFLPKLPDRGYSVSRALGLLLWAFVFWLLGSYGILANDSAGLVFAFLVLIGTSVWAWRSLPMGSMLGWLREKRSYVVTVEILFLLAFVAMAFLRASNPNINHTEQPMELAFINAILRSPAMPPHDPWLSGYSISYYYFGYVMVAMLANVSGAVAGIAFNLGLAMIYAMAALGAYGLAYNLLAIKRPEARKSNRWAALLAPVFVLILGNVEGLLEILHAQQLFWSVDAAGNQSSTFWSWLDIRDLVNPPIGEAALQPRNYGTGSWWWWRASRVINDVNFLGGQQELIDEFPAFSFVLGDLHPHVLSMPFVFLAMSLGFNMFLGGADADGSKEILGVSLGRDYLILTIVVLGGLAFLNIWDFPIYLLLFAGLYAYKQGMARGYSSERLKDFLNLLVVLGLGGVLAYIPFYLGFNSQAGGILPNLLNPTRGTHFWVMFATLLIPIFFYLLVKQKEDWHIAHFAKGLGLALALVVGLWLFSLGLAWLYATFLGGGAIGQAILSGLGAPDLESLFAEAFHRRLRDYGGWLTLVMLLGLIIGLLWRDFSTEKVGKDKIEKRLNAEGGNTFVLLLALFAGLLVLAPEFVYLRDHFGTRMNTVFKFYIQAWLIWGVVAAYSVVILLSEMRSLGRGIAAVVVLLVIGVGMVYPVFAYADVYGLGERRSLNLDGTSYISADELEAIDWLQEAPLKALVEAVGGSYNSSYARFATLGGQQGVMGWPGHESQWRGGSVDYVPRIGEIEIVYASADWDRAKEILQRYVVGYLIVGPVERSTYTVNDVKFQNNLETLFQNESVTIYHVP